MNKNSILKIKISTPTGGKPFMRQLPSLTPLWSNCQFLINELTEECDLWVVYGGIKTIEQTLCTRNNTLFITAEPPSIKKYPKKFTDQFGAILTCQKDMKHPNLILKQQSLPWWVGYKFINKVDDGKYSKTYDELKSIRDLEKSKLISVVVSNKKFTKGHRERLAFIEKLKESFGDNIDIFGAGFNEIDDKWDAIASYKYHIVLENNSLDDYWTEKLSDAFLGMSYPIYYGCTNIYNYFSTESLSIIDIRKPDQAISKIKSIIESDIYDKSKASILEAKELILDKYQLFPMLALYANNHINIGKKELVTIHPETETQFIKIIKKFLKLFKK